jgi:hypothetical protein
VSTTLRHPQTAFSEPQSMQEGSWARGGRRLRPARSRRVGPNPWVPQMLDGLKGTQPFSRRWKRCHDLFLCHARSCPPAAAESSCDGYHPGISTAAPRPGSSHDTRHPQIRCAALGPLIESIAINPIKLDLTPLSQSQVERRVRTHVATSPLVTG